MGLIVCQRTGPRNEAVLIPFQDGTRCGTQPDCPAIAENPGWATADSQSDGVPPRCLKGKGEYNAVRHTWARVKKKTRNIRHPSNP